MLDGDAGRIGRIGRIDPTSHPKHYPVVLVDDRRISDQAPSGAGLDP
jgi:hypothetical protein